MEEGERIGDGCRRDVSFGSGWLVFVVVCVYLKLV